MRYLTLLLISLPVFLFAQLTPQQEATIDSLVQLTETAEHDSVIVRAW